MDKDLIQLHPLKLSMMMEDFISLLSKTIVERHLRLLVIWNIAGMIETKFIYFN
jgi:hypothetical protein